MTEREIFALIKKWTNGDKTKTIVVKDYKEFEKQLDDLVFRDCISKEYLGANKIKVKFRNEFPENPVDIPDTRDPKIVRIIEMLTDGKDYKEICDTCKTSTNTIQRVKRYLQTNGGKIG